MSQNNWTRKTNENIKIAEASGRYAYLYRLIYGTMNHMKIRIIQAKTANGRQYVKSIASGEWLEFYGDIDYLTF